MAYAIIRHEKVKAGRHLVATGLHNVRGIATPNAHRHEDAVQVLVGTDKPWRDVMGALARLGITKVRKDGNVAFEVILTTSPEYWDDKGWVVGEKPSAEARNHVDAWVKVQMDYLRSKYGQLLTSAVLHLDEKTPHVHALVIPAQHRVDGRVKGAGAGKEAWRLSAEKMIAGPAHLKVMVTEYAEANAVFGLKRGEDRAAGTVHHQTAKDWQAAQAMQAERRRLAAEQAKQDAQRVIAYAEETGAMLIEDAERQALAVDAERIAIAAEKVELGILRTTLEQMIASADRLLGPIRAMADQWLGGTSLVKQALGLRGANAALIVGCDEVRSLSKLAEGLRGSSLQER